MRKTGLVVLALLLLMGCGGAGTERAARPATTTVLTPLGRWQTQHITHYRFDFHPSCFCSNVDTRIEVQNGKVVRTTMLPPNETASVHLGTDGQQPTIDKLLSDVARAQSGGATGDVRVSYDPKYGVPIKASIDWIKNAIDDEMAWTITGFMPL